MTTPALKYPRIINDDGEVRLEQTAPPNGYLQVIRNSDGKEITSTPCVTTEPKDEIIRLLLGAWVRCQQPSPGAGAQAGLVQTIAALNEFVNAVKSAPWLDTGPRSKRDSLIVDAVDKGLLDLEAALGGRVRRGERHRV